MRTKHSESRWAPIQGSVRGHLLAPSFMALAMLVGCTQLPGPVQKVTINADDVKSAHVHLRHLHDVRQRDGSLLIEDAGVISRCVAELNSLSCEPYRPRSGQRLDEDAIFVLEDKGGNRVAGFAFTRDVCIHVSLGKSKPFYVKYEKTPTIGRLFSCSQYVTARATLVGIIDRNWSDDLKMEHARSALGLIRRIRKDLNVPEASSLQEIPELARYLPEPRLDRLEEYPDVWD